MGEEASLRNMMLEIKINLESKYLFRMRKSKYVTELRKLTINTTVRTIQKNSVFANCLTHLCFPAAQW